MGGSGQQGFGGAGFSDIFEDIFGMGGANRKKHAAMTYVMIFPLI